MAEDLLHTCLAPRKFFRIYIAYRVASKGRDGEAAAKDGHDRSLPAALVAVPAESFLCASGGARMIGETRQRDPEAPSLEVFMTKLAGIAPRQNANVAPESDLIEDLGFDAEAFARLSHLLAEDYGVGGLSSVSMRGQDRVTVTGFFDRCVLQMLGFVTDEARA